MLLQNFYGHNLIRSLLPRFDNLESMHYSCSVGSVSEIPRYLSILGKFVRKFLWEISIYLPERSLPEELQYLVVITVGRHKDFILDELKLEFRLPSSPQSSVQNRLFFERERERKSRKADNWSW